MHTARLGGSLLLLCLSAAAQALTSQHDLLLDFDGQPGTGCSVSTPDGPFDGVEAILSTTVETDGLSAANVTAVTRSECTDAATDTFGAPVNVGGGWPVGVGEGIAGFHVIETSTPVPPALRFHRARIGIVASNELGDSVTLLDVNSTPIYLRGLPPLPVPVAAAVVLFGLALTLLLLGVLVLGRRGRMTLTSVVLLLGAGAVGAGAVYSGVLAEWGPDDLLAETSATDPDGGVDIRALFGQRSGDGLTAFFRIDSALLFAASPVAQADDYTTELTAPISEGSASGLLANDNRGLPAADLASFGGGDLSTDVTDHAAGATVAVGADGSLTVNADGSFDFQAETGFDGPFTFDYRLENVAGTADATVTIAVQRPAGAVDDAFDVLAGETLDTGNDALLSNDTGWPAPQISAFGGGDLGGAVDDNTAGDTVTVGGDGSLSVNADGQVVFTPSGGFTGDFSFDYRIDNAAGTDTATVIVTVNEAPTVTSAGSFSCSVGSVCEFSFAADGYPQPTITVAGALPAGVTFNAGAESLEGTPQAGSGAVYVLTVTAANGIGSDAEQTFTLTVNEAPTITSADSLGCEVSAPCDFTVSADGHPAPTFSLPGLPAGLNLDASTGVISGQPDAGTGGEYNLVLEADNSEGSDTQNFTLTVGQPPAITSSETLDCAVGQSCSLTLAADGFPAPDFSVTGALPDGVSFDGTDLIDGTPQAGSGAVYALTITATNGITPDAVQTLTLTVSEAPTITSAASLGCEVGVPCDFTVSAGGHPAPTFSLPGLPTGLSLDASTGVISGQPDAGTGGEYNLVLEADNSEGSDTQNFTLTVGQPPAITSSETLDCAVGQSCSLTLAADGFPAPDFSVTGALPDGVSFDGTDLIDGTPQAGSGAVYALTITATNGITPDAVQTLILTVNEPPAITSANATTCQTGQSCTFTFTADGFPAPTFSIADPLPDGLSLDGASGVLSGSPAGDAGGAYALTVTATNGIGTDATQNFTLTVEQAPIITSAASLTCEVGSTCSFTATADGYPDPGFTLPGLPAGLGIDGVSGALSGTPDAGTGGVYNLTLTAANGVSPDATQNFELTVNEAPAITSAAATTCQTGQSCTFTFTADGFPDPTFSIADPLPDGLSLDGASGALSGSPAGDAGGVYALTVTATNGIGTDATQNFTLTVEQPPIITSAASLTCEVGSTCSFIATADGYPDPGFTLPGLPAGLGIDGVSGALSGTPDAGTGGVYNLTLTAANGVSPDATQNFELTVNEAPAITSAAATSCQTGQPCAFTFTADGYPDPTFDILESLPSGLSLDAASGQLSGTPDAGTGGVYALTVTATNGIGTDATQNFTLTVEQAPIITSAASLTCEVGSTCSFTATADGYPDPGFTLPGLPAGLGIDGVSGALSGTPDVGTGGVYDLTLTAANGVSPNATQNFELTVNEAPAITSAAATSCQTGQPCAFTFTADGYPDPTFDILESLPSGLSLDAVSGQLSGTPDAGTGGEYALTLEADNGIGPAATQGFTLTIGEAPTITSADNVTCEVGASCSFAFSATGYPDPDILVSGSMPSGVTFDAVTDSLTGVPDAGAGGVYALNVDAANGFTPDAAQTFTLTVNESPQAVDDPTGGIPAGSSPGSMPYHGSLDTTLVVNAASGVLANDQLGFPTASIDSLTTTSNAGGFVTLTGDGGFSYEPPTGFTGIDVFTYCLDNDIVSPLPCADVEVAVGERPSASDVGFAETLIGNTDIDTARSSGYSLYNLAGGDEITVSLVAATNGDAVVNSSSGTFSFDPAAGFNGSATLEYQVSNGFAETPTGTVTFTVDDMIWYYDNSAAAGGDGRLSSPFNSLAGASASAIDDIHFVYAGSGDYTGGIVLLGGQVLIGQEAAGMLSSLLAPAVPADSVLPSTGARPLIVNAAGAGVALGTNNTLRGFNVGNTSSFGVLGNTFGSLTVDDVSITGSGSGLSLDTGTVTGSGFDQVNATAGSHGILLTAVNGTVALGSGAVSGATTAALELNGGSANVSYGGSLQPGAGGRPLLVQNKTGGLVELTGAVSSTALGVRVANNSATTTRLAGGLDLVTGINSAFQASLGGVVEVCDDNPCNPVAVGGLVNTLSTTTGVALDVADTTIGGNNLEFRSISAGTAASGSASGIVLDTTGSSGGLKVRGTGSAGSGGTIRNSTTSGIVLIDTDNVELASMTVSGSATHGIDGTLVAGFELVDANVTGNGDAANEEGINFFNLSGPVSLIDVVATGNAYHNLRIDNDSGTISSLVISGGSFSNNDPVLGNHGILITPRGSSVISSASVDGVTLSGNYSLGMHVSTADSAVVNSFVVANSTFEGNELGLDFSKAQKSSLAFDIDGNVFTGQNSHGLNVFTAVGAGTTGTFRGIIRNNTVGQAGVDGSGSVIGNCMRVNINGDTDAAVRVDNNVLRECPNGRGLEVIGRNGTGSLDVTVVNNDIDHVNLDFDPGTSDFPLAAIMIQSNCATVCNTVRSDVRNNSVPAGTASDFTSGFITLIESNASTLQLVDTLPTSPDCVTQLGDTNTGSVGVSGACALIAGPIDSP